jgi:hypothetical protein
MKDGSYYEGDFLNGEMTGKGSRTFEDGTEYVGEFVGGEKEGYGEIKYGKRNIKEHSYKGNWVGNQRHGYGELLLRNNSTIKGNFVCNQANGDCRIIYHDNGNEFTGNLLNGVPEGFGLFKSENDFSYKGNFTKGSREDEGTIFVQNGTYSLQSSFKNNEPAYLCNRFSYELVSPALKVEIEDPKAKKDPKAAPSKKDFTEEEE